MIKKQPMVDDGLFRVTFELPASVFALRISVVGDFNGWDPTVTPMEHNQAKARWETTIELEAGRRYRFRYLVDGRRWLNDWQADGYVRNQDRMHDSIVDLTEFPRSSPS